MTNEPMKEYFKHYKFKLNHYIKWLEERYEFKGKKLDRMLSMYKKGRGLKYWTEEHRKVFESQAARIAELEAQLWVANDKGLRTYDGMTTDYDKTIEEQTARIAELEALNKKNHELAGETLAQNIMRAKTITQLREALEGMIEQHCDYGEVHPHNIKINGHYFYDAELSANELTFATLKEIFGDKDE